ncbi:MAG: amylo-alpha-1,6-glucosidase, partial [bacterium]
MEDIVRSVQWNRKNNSEANLLLGREWLATNGIGGYASGTICGIPTRRYHGFLISALPFHFGRMVMLSHVSEKFILADGTSVSLGFEERAGGDTLESFSSGYLTEFRLDAGLPVWRYEINGVVIEKQLHLPYMQNTIHITYRLISGSGPVRVEIRPFMNFRHHEAPVGGLAKDHYKITIIDNRYEVSAGHHLPSLLLFLYNGHSAFTSDGGSTIELIYRTEAERGYESRGMLWNPGYFRAELEQGQKATLVASTESWTTVLALKPDEAIAAERERRRRLIDTAPDKAKTGMAAELVLAADQFIITPAWRIEDAVRARALGDEEVRTIIAGYHWFTDWGRDTMISLEGLTLSTGRYHEANSILHTFAHYIKDGLIPNLFPEGSEEGLYHTADATLWFFHAVDRYVEVSGDHAILRLLGPKLKEIADHHLRGTHFGIAADPEDGLLRQGAEGYQLTWMDAKVDGWVVTPRRGKAVEINALWYNALRLLARWLLQSGAHEAADHYEKQAQRTYDSFNRRFWYEEGGYLYDVIDGEHGHDTACRPNQILAVSLRYPVLDQGRWRRVLDVVHEKLLTPVGLRSLAPGHPDYKPKYFGDIHARDAAYHQGTIWAWLIGPFIDAWLKVYPDDLSGARSIMAGFEGHLGDSCIGSINEIYDAEHPFTPRGCIAQAWSVAEVLRCWLKTS